MASAVTRGIKEVHANVDIQEVNRALLEDDSKKGKTFVLIGSNDFWRNGQWTRYCKERMED